MNNIDCRTVIVWVCASAVTVQIIIKINIKKLNNILHEFQQDIIETCTNEVANYIKENK